MRWEQLFADLESQANAAGRDQWRVNVQERTRAARTDVEWGSRLLASVGGALTVTSCDGARISGVLTDAAHQWLLLTDGGARQHLMPASAVDVVHGLANAPVQAGVVERRLSFAAGLRALSRDRARVQIVVRSGDYQGVIASVGKDSCDVALEGGTRVTVPLQAILRCSSGANA